MIEVDNLCKYYGSVAAIRNVSFQVGQGEILGFLGPNGAGKTTTMRILTGYFPATSGSARVAGFDVFNQLDEVRRRIGYLPENVPLYTDMSVEGYLHYVAQIKGMGGADKKKAVNQVLEDCGLVAMRHRLIKKLSRGYRQRVGLAQALVNDPQVLVLDEPTVGLDPKQITEIRSLVKHLAGKRTVILSTHILPEVSVTCDKVVIINQGRIVAADTLENLTERNTSDRRVAVTVRGDAGKAERLLKDIPGILSVTREAQDANATPGSATFIVTSHREPDPRAAVAKAVAGSDLELLELASREITLEEVFIRSISADSETRSVEPEEPADGVGSSTHSKEARS